MNLPKKDPIALAGIGSQFSSGTSARQEQDPPARGAQGQGQVQKGGQEGYPTERGMLPMERYLAEGQKERYALFNKL